MNVVTMIVFVFHLALTLWFVYVGHEIIYIWDGTNGK